MGIDLPPELAGLLNDLGYTWPEVDEGDLFDLGQKWMTFAGTLGDIHGDAQAVAKQVISANSGSDIDSFMGKWEHEHAAPAVLRDGATGAQIVGAALMICAAVVLGLKVNVIVQLITLLMEIVSAIAEAVPTLGASLLEIPVFKELTGMLINLIVNLALNAILGQ